MALRLLPIGVQDFEKIRTNDFVYVDKTDLIYRLTHSGGGAFFLSRPRRFGKSLLCTTLRYYFEGRRELFNGLAIDKLETEWKKYPVLHFDMSECKENDADLVKAQLDMLLSQYERLYRLDSAPLSFGGRLKRLIETASELTGNQVVLIFDEYDSPLLNVISDRDKMEEIRSVFNLFYVPVKSMDKYLRFVFITGITKFSQMSIFSTINNLRNISMDKQWETICGITQSELEDNFEERLQALGEDKCWSREQTMAELRDNYDGYHFGPALTDIYNPFSILNALDDLELNDYWFNSATPSSLIATLRHYPVTLTDFDGMKVPQGGFDQPFDNFSSAVPILYQSGYLTIKDYNPALKLYTLGIPNGEVRRGLFFPLTQHYLGKDNMTTNRFVADIKLAVYDDRIDIVLERLKDYLSALPHHLSNKTHRDAETMLRLFFDGLGANIETEVQSAIGRCDIVLKNDKTIYLIELKMPSYGTVDSALSQIDEKNYLAPYRDDPRRKVKVGLVFDPETRTIRDWKTAE